MFSAFLGEFGVGHGRWEKIQADLVGGSDQKTHRKSKIFNFMIFQKTLFTHRSRFLWLRNTQKSIFRWGFDHEKRIPRNRYFGGFRPWKNNALSTRLLIWCWTGTWRNLDVTQYFQLGEIQHFLNCDPTDSLTCHISHATFPQFCQEYDNYIVYSASFIADI